MSDGHVRLSVTELQICGVEQHAHALARCVGWQPREDIVKRRECFARFAAKLLDQSGLALHAGKRHDVARGMDRDGFAVRDKCFVVTASNAVDIADGLMLLPPRGRIRGASLGGSPEVVERLW